MKLVGITGGIGMGKSKAGEILQQRGLPVIDTDMIARSLVEPNQPALGEIRDFFGESILNAEGGLKRDELARRVFADPSSRQKLESILHPRIREVWQSEADKWSRQGNAVGFVTIPLLFETGAAPQFEATVCLACLEKTQHQRLMARGWSVSEVQQRLAAQWPVQKKMDASTFLIWTETSLEIHAAQWDYLLAHYLR